MFTRAPTRGSFKASRAFCNFWNKSYKSTKTKKKTLTICDVNAKDDLKIIIVEITVLINCIIIVISISVILPTVITFIVVVSDGRKEEIGQAHGLANLWRRKFFG